MKPGEIRAERVSRRFRVNPEPVRTLKELVLRRGRPPAAEVWALQDVSLAAEPGDAVGLVGRNGSGKTTLLSLIAGVKIDEESARPVIRQAQGWAVPLRLAAIQLGGSFSPRAVADDLDTPGGPIWEYLETEVLDRMPPADVDFLVETSVVPEVTPELCEAVTGRTDARRLLDTLVIEHQFVEQASVKGVVLSCAF